jgi:hypothetical protein
MNIRCLFQGHDWKKVSESGFKFDPTDCVEHHNPFNLSPCHIDEADVVEVKLTCRVCKKTISYEA